MRNRQGLLHLRYEVFAGRYRAEVVFDGVRYPGDRTFIIEVLHVILSILQDKAAARISRPGVRFTGGFTLMAAWDCDMLIFDQDE